jgi:hypothetical protein
LAQRHSHGVRLAKQYELDSDLLALAMKSSKAAMLEAADYLAERGHTDKAATLYLKAGKLRKAVDMCFEGQLFDVLNQVLHSVPVPIAAGILLWYALVCAGMCWYVLVCAGMCWVVLGCVCLC